MGRIKNVEKIAQNAQPGNCRFCGKFCKNQNSLRQHQTRCSQNPNPKDQIRIRSGQAIENLRKAALKRKGKTEILERCCQFCKKTWNTSISGLKNHELHCYSNPSRKEGSFSGRKRSVEEKQYISSRMKEIGAGGYREGSGRGKKGHYKGFYCDSSWELAYVIYNLDHNIEFERNEELFPYEFNGEQHKYKPDFIENGIYVEIKGYFTEQVKAKEFAFPYQLKYIDKESIKPYLSYVEEKYGKDFIRLYE